MFIDEVILKVEAGKGGDGCSSFRHEKYIEMGGPDGGNGGKGGDIVFVADEGLTTLLDLRYLKTVKGSKGSNGKGSNKTGESGEDTIIKVPVGTMVKDEKENKIICDLVKNGESFIVAKGGRGGRGNAAFKTNKLKAPLTSEYGEPGEEKTLKIELKLLADVGLVGYPSVGKSSLINVLSKAKAKVADYHFTTLTPNLGVVKVDDFSFVVADLPGIIEGASEGIGLGDKFLKHASRCKVIAFVLDMSESENRSVIDDYKVLEKELKNYSEALYNKKRIVIANKMDLPTSIDNLKKFKETYKDLEVVETSAATLSGINDLKYKIKELLLESEEEVEENDSFTLYEYKKEVPYTIEKENDHTWVIKGDKVELLLKMTKFNSEEATLRFARILKGMKVDEELRRMGAKEGDTIRILDYEFEYEERLNY